MTDNIETVIWRWIDEVVINESFCPFAKASRQQNKIALDLISVSDFSDALNELQSAYALLDENSSIETLIIACKEGLEDFFDYLDCLDQANFQLQELGYEGIYQLASFHPNYTFADSTKNCVSNYTNRSPLPLFHIIREQSIENALKTFKKPELIPKRNIEHASNLGVDFFKRYIRTDSL